MSQKRPATTPADGDPSITRPVRRVYVVTCLEPHSSSEAYIDDMAVFDTDAKAEAYTHAEQLKWILSYLDTEDIISYNEYDEETGRNINERGAPKDMEAIEENFKELLSDATDGERMWDIEICNVQ